MISANPLAPACNAQTENTPISNLVENGIKPYYISPEPTPQTENFFIDVIIADNINNRAEQIPQSSKLIYIYTLFQYGGQSFRKIWVLDNSNRAYGQGTPPIGAGNLIEFNTQALQQNSVVDLGDIGALVGNETYEEHLRDYINAQDPSIGLINSGTIRADFGGDVREFNFSNVTGDYGLNVNQTEVTDFQLYGESNNEEDTENVIIDNTKELKEQYFKYDYIVPNKTLITASEAGWDIEFREMGNILSEYNRKILVYSGYEPPYVGNNSYLGIAISTDNGNTYVKGGINNDGKIINRSLEDGYLVKFNDTYFIYAEDKEVVPFKNIRCYTSQDLINWNDEGIVLDVGNEGDWDEYDVSSPTVFIENGILNLFYEGRGLDNGGSIGLATSTDGLTFTKEVNNPVNDASNIEWAESIVPDDIVKVNDGYYLNAHAYKGDVFSATTLFSTDLINWVDFKNGYYKFYNSTDDNLGNGLMILESNNKFDFIAIDSLNQSKTIKTYIPAVNSKKVNTDDFIDKNGLPTELINGDGTLRPETFFTKAFKVTGTQTLDVDTIIKEGLHDKLILSNSTNIPTSQIGYILVLKLNDDRLTQIWFPYNNTDGVYFRYSINGVFSDWLSFLHLSNDKAVKSKLSNVRYNETTKLLEVIDKSSSTFINTSNTGFSERNITYNVVNGRLILIGGATATATTTDVELLTLPTDQRPDATRIISGFGVNLRVEHNTGNIIVLNTTASSSYVFDFELTLNFL